MSTRHSRLIASVQTGVLAAVMAVLSQIAIPMPGSVPLTLQTFAVALCVALGGIRKGVPAVLIYLALGAAGVPVFAGFRGGIGVLLAHTGGFLWGFVPMALLCGSGVHTGSRIWTLTLGSCGLLLCHLCGVLQYMAVSGLDFAESFLLISLPYLLKDMLSLAAACFSAEVLRRAMQRAGMQKL